MFFYLFLISAVKFLSLTMDTESAQHCCEVLGLFTKQPCRNISASNIRPRYSSTLCRPLTSVMYCDWLHIALFLEEIISFPVHFDLRYNLAQSGLMAFIEITHSFTQSSEYNSVNRSMGHFVCTSGM
jgi:hypothetical protein